MGILSWMNGYLARPERLRELRMPTVGSYIVVDSHLTFTPFSYSRGILRLLVPVLNSVRSNEKNCSVIPGNLRVSEIIGQLVSPFSREGLLS